MPRVDVEAMATELAQQRRSALDSPPAGPAGANAFRVFGPVARYLAAARADIRRNLRPPLPPGQVAVLERLVEELVGLLDEQGALLAETLNRPVTGGGRVHDGEALLDMISGYKTLSAHFFDEAVTRARAGRPSDQVRLEVTAVSEAASVVKTAVVGYLEAVEQDLKGLEHR